MTPKIEELQARITKPERRLVPKAAGKLELRATEGEDPKIGMFIPFNKPSVEMMGFTEMIAPGAFARSIKNGRGAKRSDVVALWNHDPVWVLGRQANKTLELRESEQGLEGEVTLDAGDPMHQSFARRVQRGDVQGSSFGFETVRDEWEYEDDGTVTRTLLEVKLYDISPVTYPAYPDSQAEERSRSVLDVAAVKTGLDCGELALLLQEVREGKIPAERSASLRSWLDRLEALLPPPAVPPIDWKRRLDLRERLLRSASRSLSQE